MNQQVIWTTWDTAIVLMLLIFPFAAHQPPNHTPIPCTTPTGKNAAAAIIRGRIWWAEQNTIEVSHAA